eukprot:XP_001707574.1 Hypothetical protein GL50803_88876 [Giardia lamblia ATCC 50803]
MLFGGVGSTLDKSEPPDRKQHHVRRFHRRHIFLHTKSRRAPRSFPCIPCKLVGCSFVLLENCLRPLD